MTFGEKIIKYRNDNGLTQDELAKIVGTTKQVISRYEKGQRTPKIDVVQEYAKKLNLSVLYLVDNNVTIIPATDTNVLTNHEGKVVTAYRGKPLIQPAVDKLLDVEPEKETAPSSDDAVLSVAARGTAITGEQFDKIFSVEDTLERSTD